MIGKITVLLLSKSGIILHITFLQYGNATIKAEEKEKQRERQEILKWSLIKSSHYRKGGLISQANTGVISKRVLSV
jgi:hypothetical protein